MAHISLLSAMIILPLCIIFFFKILRFDPGKETFLMYYRDLDYIDKNSHDSNIKFVFLLLSLFTLSGLIYLLYSIRDIPFLMALLGSNQGIIGVLRINVLKGNFILGLINEIIGNWIAPVLTLTIYAYYLKTSRRVYLVLFVLNFIITCLFLIYRTEKAPIALFLMNLFFLYGIFRGRILLKSIMTLTIAVLALLSIQYIVFMGANDVDAALNNIISRIFFSQHVGTVLSFDYFPEHEDFLAGKLFVPFSSYLFGQEEAKSFALRLMDYYNPAATRIGTAGYMSTLFIAEGYANWGWLGIFLSIIIVGIFLSLCMYFMHRVRKHPVNLALFAFFCIHIPFKLNSGFRIAVYSPALMLTVFTFLIVIFFARKKLRIYIDTHRD